MAKKDLISGSLWEQYSQKVSDRMNHPTYIGEISEEEAEALKTRLVVADWGAEACGDAVQLYWAVDPISQRILKARFKSFGCGTAIASCDMMCEMCEGKTVDEALKITNLDVENSLRDEQTRPAIPPQKMHCSVMAYDVIKKAAALFKGVDMKSFEKEEIVCECARVSLSTIKEIIRLNNLTTVEQITQYTKAGAFCKSCVRPGGHEKRKYYLTDILLEVRAQMARDDSTRKSAAPTFKEMTLIQKHRVVEDILDKKVRSNLMADGGNIEIIDMKENQGKTEVLIKYQGACVGCPSSRTGTLSLIQQTLQQEIDPDILVITAL